MVEHMTTTISLDDQLLAEAERAAANTGRTLSAVVEDALREALARRPRPTKAEPIRLLTDKGDGPWPGVNLDNTAELLDLMEGGDAPR
jgi:hypothetical protein